MINSISIFVLRMNHRQVTDGQFFLAMAEFVATAIIVAIIRNT